MENKEFYIAPEVEIMCFRPVEALAANAWNWGNGSIEEEDPENGGIEITSNGDS